MSDTNVPLPDLNSADAPGIDDIGYNEDEHAARIAADLEAVFDVPVQVSAVLGRSKMDVGDLLKLGPGTVLELDRRV
ncbi:FliM/FliN family flagellar motor switch protein, partial [Escherichia coli]|nr:FliM/FliN family flagellar motor switch protein [Escherichia coli]